MATLRKYWWLAALAAIVLVFLLRNYKRDHTGTDGKPLSWAQAMKGLILRANYPSIKSAPPSSSRET